MPGTSAGQYFARLFHRRSRSGRRDIARASTTVVISEPIEASAIFAKLATNEPLPQSRTSKECKHFHPRPISCPARASHLPEHQSAARNRLQLDQAIPKALQQSQTSIDLQTVSRSPEAGCLPFCEDVAQRNINARKLRIYGSSVPGPRTSSLQHRSPSVPSDDALPGHRRQYTSLRGSERAARRHTLADVPTAALSAENANSVYLPPLRKDGRRRSLSHKLDVLDLRTASKTGCSGRWQSPRTIRWESPRSIHSPVPGLSLDKPLPPPPLQGLIEAAGLQEAAEPQARPGVNLRDLQDHISQNASQRFDSRQWSAPQGREDTTWYEEWRPAVTHEIIRPDVHEVREEHIRKELHQYHVHRKTQPIVDYEILPARHFVHLEGGGYAEVAEEDLPAGTPGASWFTTEITSQLDSSVQAIHGDPACEEARVPSDEGPAEEESWEYSTIFKPALLEDTLKYRFAFAEAQENGIEA